MVQNRNHPKKKPRRSKCQPDHVTPVVLSQRWMIQFRKTASERVRAGTCRRECTGSFCLHSGRIGARKTSFDNQLFGDLCWCQGTVLQRSSSCDSQNGILSPATRQNYLSLGLAFLNVATAFRLSEPFRISRSAGGPPRQASKNLWGSAMISALT